MVVCCLFCWFAVLLTDLMLDYGCLIISVCSTLIVSEVYCCFELLCLMIVILVFAVDCLSCVICFGWCLFWVVY